MSSAGALTVPHPLSGLRRLEMLVLLGAQMDFKVDRLSATFAFSNPNETSACGCGESVAITPASPEALTAPA